MAQLQQRFASEATLASLRAEALQLDGALEAERERNRALAAEMDDGKKKASAVLCNARRGAALILCAC